MSSVVHALPSLQGAVLNALTHTVAGLQLSSVQTFPSLQSGGGPPTHAPPLQVSFVVQALPSLHALVLFVCLQPVAGSHASSVQGLPSSQFGATLPTHAPSAQTSTVVQALPSLQGAVLFTFSQPVAGLQLSSVQTFPSLQSGGAPPTH